MSYFQKIAQNASTTEQQQELVTLLQSSGEEMDKFEAEYQNQCAKYQRISDHISAIELEIATAKNKIISLENEILKLTTQNDELAPKIHSSHQEVEALDAKVHQLSQQSDEYQALINYCSKELELQKAQKAEYQHNIELGQNIQQLIIEKENFLKLIETEIEAKEAEYIQIQQTIESTQALIAQQQRIFEKMQQIIAEHKVIEVKKIDPTMLLIEKLNPKDIEHTNLGKIAAGSLAKIAARSNLLLPSPEEHLDISSADTLAHQDSSTDEMSLESILAEFSEIDGSKDFASVAIGEDANIQDEYQV